MTDSTTPQDAAAMSPASAGSVGERPLGDPEVAVEILNLRVAELEQAIRRLAEQDATLSVQGGNVIVEMDATPTLTHTERVAVEIAADACGNCNGFGGDTRRPALYEGDRIAATLRGLLERTK